MIHQLRNIYDRLNFGPNQAVNATLTSKEALNYLGMQITIFTKAEAYSDLFKEILRLRVSILPMNFIERYCLGKMSSLILQSYDMNIAEAYVISYVILSTIVSRSVAGWKVFTSGLIQPTLIDGVMVRDAEAISTFIIRKLHKEELLKITSQDQVVPGPKLKLNVQ